MTRQLFSQNTVGQLMGSLCLKPIREVMNLNEVSQLANLLTYLETESLILKVSGLNLPEDYTGTPDYLMGEILMKLLIDNSGIDNFSFQFSILNYS